MFQSAIAFNQDIGDWNTASVTDMKSMLRNAILFNQDIGDWNTAQVTDMFDMFNSATSFNQDIGGWNTAQVTDMEGVFTEATSFNQDIGGWNTAQVTKMPWMFARATSFDQNMGGWNVEAVANMQNMFKGVTLSIANYDALLTGWDAQNLTSGVSFHGGDSKYNSEVAHTARENMKNSDNWNIRDGGRIQPNVHPPVFGGATATVAENNTEVTTVVATDADAEQTVTFTLTGGADESKFSITMAGELTFNSAPDYENPTDMGSDNMYEVMIMATDGHPLSPMTATQTFTITVTDEVLEHLFTSRQGTFTPLTDATAVPSIEADDTVSESLPVGFDFTFYGTTYSTLKASSNGFLTFTEPSGRLWVNGIAGTAVATSVTYAIMPFWDDLNGSVDGAQASYKVTGSSPNRVYTFEWLNFGRVGTTGQISFQVSLHETSNVIELVYGPGALTAGTRSVSASIGIKGVATDFFSLAGRGTSPMRSSGGNDIIASKPPDGQVYQFALPPPPVANVAPVITSNGGGIAATVVVAENNTAVVTTVVTVDANTGQTVTFTLSGADAGLFTLSSTGELTFNTAPDYEMPTDAGGNNMYEVTVTATDNGMPAMTATQVLTITVTGVANEHAPVFTSEMTMDVAEGTTAVITVIAMDADVGETVTFTLSGGADVGLFSITPAGELTFNTAPDYEVPTDMGTDNMYEVTITATDNGMPAKMAMQTLTITVTDVNDHAPVFAGGTTMVDVEEGTTAVTTVTATDADAGQTVTFLSTLSGADAGLFSITTTGELTFTIAPDYENPESVSGSNVYTITVTATDGQTPPMTAMQRLTITVTNVENEHAPVFTSEMMVDVAEGTTAVTTVIATDADVEQTVTFLSTLSGADESKFSITSAGVLTFNTAPDYENPSSVSESNVYTVTVTATDGQTAPMTAMQRLTITVTDEDDVPTGLEAFTDISVYPNPAGEVLHISGVAGNARYTLSGMEGKIVKRGKLEASTADHSVAVPSLKQGIYLLQITMGEGSIIRKIVKE